MNSTIKTSDHPRTPVHFAFFGSSRFSVITLDTLEQLGFLPTCIVTTPDKPQGRKQIITPNIVKVWAQQRGIKTYDPASLKDDLFFEQLKQEACQVFVVASYGKIIPTRIIDLPPARTLNIHPSLLPLYRGASPLQSAMLDDAKNTGVTIMRINEKMDEGPIVIQEKITVAEWPTYEEFETLMAQKGAQLLASVLPGWVVGTVKEQEQDHAAATYTKKISKEDARIDLAATDPYLTFRKIQAYHEWPQAYFFVRHGDKDIRVKITAASFQDGKLVIEKVIPESAKEMSWNDFQSGYKLQS